MASHPELAKSWPSYLYSKSPPGRSWCFCAWRTREFALTLRAARLTPSQIAWSAVCPNLQLLDDVHARQGIPETLCDGRQVSCARTSARDERRLRSECVAQRAGRVPLDVHDDDDI